MEQFVRILPSVERQLQKKNERVYKNSLTRMGEDRFVVARFGDDRFILIMGGGALYRALDGRETDLCKISACTHKNRMVFNRFLDYTAPRAFGRQTATIGLGDRLGLASPAHIRVTVNRNIKPILAQQSKRELDLTGRTYRDVLDDVCFAILQEGYRGGFGADGDHLKKEADIEDALHEGCSMITLDCSEQIGGRVEGFGKKTIREEYMNLPGNVRNYYEKNYLGKEYTNGQGIIAFNEDVLAREVLLYHKAIDFIEHVYRAYVSKAGSVDFEISLDETDYPTTFTGHFLVASELHKRNIGITSMAPRFIGEFQKGIDYIGDIGDFENNIRTHAEIADRFGYKLSIHSGSDKFSVFGLIGRYTKNRLHIKTSGTNWLEAVRVIILKNPCLYREMHRYALLHLNEARAYYHVDADASLIKKIEDTADDDLLDYMKEKNARQSLHITYGFLLNAKENGRYLFKDEIYKTLMENEELYCQGLIRHIGKHLDCLGIPADTQGVV